MIGKPHLPNRCDLAALKSVSQASRLCSIRPTAGTAVPPFRTGPAHPTGVRKGRGHLVPAGSGGLIAGILLVLAVACAGAADGPRVPPEIAKRLESLEAKLSSVETLKVDFVQEKELSILSQKLVLKGRITLRQPDKLAWRVRSPIRYTMVIDGATLRQWSDDTDDVQQVSLARNPAFGVAVKQIRSWFSGNYLALTSDFEVAIAREAPLALRFTPRAASPTRELIRRIVMRFGADERFLESLEVEETGGDTMRITFSDTVLNPALDKAEWDVKAHD
jgi:outer membrane lipoprotein-sorting protein